jgi:cytochrome b561
MIRRHYHPLSIGLHWLMFLLFATALACVEIHDWLPKGNALRDQVIVWHKDAGLLVLLFALVRISARLGLGVPVINGAPLQVRMAHGLHALLYLVMFLLPLSGVVFTQAGGHTVEFFGRVLPQWIAPNPGLRHWLRELHGLMGNAVYFLVGVHVLAALWHQLILKDDTLGRMRFK